METYEKIKQLLEGDYDIEKVNPKTGESKSETINLPNDVEKFFERGNMSAGTRIRKGMQELKKLAQQLREDVQSAKNS